MPAQASVNRHPLRGAVWGLLLGLGVAIYLVIFSVVPYGDWVTLGIAVAVAVLVGILWGAFAPAKKPKQAKPAPESTRPVPEYGGVEQVVVGPYGTDSQTIRTDPAAAAPPEAPAAPEAAAAPEAEPAADPDDDELDDGVAF